MMVREIEHVTRVTGIEHSLKDDSFASFEQGTRATCQEKGVNRKGLYEDIVEFLV